MSQSIIKRVLKGMRRKQFEKLIAGCFAESECKLIMRAYRLSKYGHRNQKRRTGERYFEHPKALAIMLILLGVRSYALICAALLHDIIEDSFILMPEDIGVWFGRCTQLLVEKVTHLRGTDKHDYFMKLLQKGGAHAWMLKLADRMHNLLTLTDGTSLRQRRRCRRKKREQVAETRQYILPMAKALSRHHPELGRWFTREITRLCKQREMEASAPIV